jgi:hypothetical protein
MLTQCVHFCCRLLELQQDVRSLFQFAGDNEEMRNDSMFQTLTSLMVRMVDTAINTLGPDSAFLNEELLRLGAQHYEYGVQPMHLLSLCKSVFYCLDKFLASEFTCEERESWQVVMKYMVSKMVKGHHNAKVTDQTRKRYMDALHQKPTLS